MEILQIPLVQITPSPFNRMVVVDRELKDLAASIKANGVLEPLTMRWIAVPAGGNYEIVFGERRHRAAILAAEYQRKDKTHSGPILDSVPCQVIEADDVRVLQLQHEENTHRTNPNPLDIANNFDHLRILGKSETEIATMYGVSKGYVYGLLGLQRASDEIREAVRKGEITASHAEILIPLKKDQSAAMLRYAVESKASVRELQDRVRQVTHKPERKSGKAKSRKHARASTQWQVDASAQIIRRVKAFTLGDCIAMVRRLGASQSKAMLAGLALTVRDNGPAILKLAKAFKVTIKKPSPRGDKPKGKGK